MSEQEQHDIPPQAAAAVAAHAETAGDGAHTAMHSHVDDARVQQVAERFETAPQDAGARHPGQV